MGLFTRSSYAGAKFIQHGKNRAKPQSRKDAEKVLKSGLNPCLSFFAAWRLCARRLFGLFFWFQHVRIRIIDIIQDAPTFHYSHTSSRSGNIGMRSLRAGCSENLPPKF